MTDSRKEAPPQLKISLTSVLPDGTTVVPEGESPFYNVEEPQARRMIDLQLHKLDLNFVANWLKFLLPYNALELEREAHWNAAMVRFFKCFGSTSAGGRTQLSATKVFRSEPDAAMVSFNRLLTLRNKTLVHDENSWTQGKLGVAVRINPSTGKTEIGHPLLYISLVATTLDDENVSNLNLLTQCALRWIDVEYAKLESELMERLLAQDAAKLMAAGPVIYTAPSHETAALNKSSAVPRAKAAR